MDHSHLPRLTLIVAMARNRVIGYCNTLPWRLPEDLQFFKRTTLGHPIVMGRKTYESIGKPLPGRRNMVISRQIDYQAPGCDVVHSLDAALALAHESREIFVIGGAQLYAEALPRATHLLITEITEDFVGDTFFPEIKTLGWVETQREVLQAKPPNHFNFAFVTYEKKQHG